MCDDLLADLVDVVGTAHAFTDERTLGYATDWTGRFSGRPRAVVRPASTEEVAAILGVCARHRTPLIAQGGNTGLVGASVPRHGEVIVSLARLDELGVVDELGGTVIVGAGATLEAVQEHTRPHGWAVGVDLAARDTATIGGMVATNAGGLQVLRHGTMRAQVRGVEAVLADGSIVRRLNGLEKDNVGYDLAGLLVGSEGTLAVVTRVCLRLVPTTPHRVTALLALDSVEDALGLVQRCRRRLVDLEAAELLREDGLAFVCTHAGLAPPFSDPPRCLLLLECAGGEDPTERLAAALADEPQVAAVAVADDRSGRERLWAYRERLPEAIAAHGTPVKLDVTLPPAAIARFIDDLPALVAGIDPNARTLVFGHLADGNLHVNVLDSDPAAHAVEDVVLRRVVAEGGSISAEHGIGVAKAPWLALARDPADIAAMRAIKHALDPGGLLNPGAVLDDPDPRAHPPPAARPPTGAAS